MDWLARAILFIPAWLAAMIIAVEHPKFPVVAMAIGLVLLAMTAVAVLYFPLVRHGRHGRNGGVD